MEGYEYVDLFATKGSEYILVIGFLIAFILFWRVLGRQARLAMAVGGNRPSATTRWFLLPREVFYHQGHTWAKQEGGDVVRVGLDDFAQKLIGRADSIEVPRVGTRVAQGEVGWRLRIGSTPVEVLSPVDGEVIATNAEAVRSPAILNDDPYGRGWVMLVRGKKLRSNLRHLLTGPVAQAWMEETVSELRRRMSGGSGLVLQDGGVPLTGFARNLSPDRWEEVAAEFLKTR